MMGSLLPEEAMFREFSSEEFGLMSVLGRYQRALLLPKLENQAEDYFFICVYKNALQINGNQVCSLGKHFAFP